MRAGTEVKKVIRSALFLTPGLYRALSSERRFVLAHRLGRVHEPDFRALPGLVNKPSPLVVDVGANVGQSVLSTLRVLPGARVIGFEPNPGNWPALDRVAKRFPAFRYEPVGLADRTGSMTLHVPSYAGKAMTGLASLDEAEARSWLSPATVYGFDPGKLTVESTEVDVRRLDDYGLAPDVVKIDVQGFEEAVVEGGRQTIGQHAPVLLVEMPSERLAATLTSLGYAEYEWDGGALWASRRRNVNQFFVPAGRVDTSPSTGGGGTAAHPPARG